MKFKKIIATVGSVLMIGATAAGAFAASYPAGMTGLNTVVVVGSGAGADDGMAANLIQNPLEIESTVVGPVVVGDESVNIGDVTSDLVLGSDIGTTALYDDDLPTVLSGGRIDKIDYEEELVINSGNNISFGSLGDEDNYVVHSADAELMNPVLHINQASGLLWTYTLTFDEAFNASKNGNEKITIAGKEYTIDPNLGSDLVLYASSNTVNLDYLEAQTVDVGGTSFVLEVTGGRDTTTAAEATVSVNGKKHTVNSGDTITVDDEDFYISDIFMSTFGDTSSLTVEVFVGAEKLEIQRHTSAQTIKLNDETIDSVEGYFTSDSDVSDINSIVLEFTPSNLEFDMDAEYQEHSYLELGESVTDPVLGTINVVFESRSQGLTEDKALVEVRRSGDELRVSFENLAGNSYTATVLKENATEILGLNKTGHAVSDFANLSRADNRRDKLILQKTVSGSNPASHIAEIQDVEMEGDVVQSVTFAYAGTSEKVSVGDVIRRSSPANLNVCYGLDVTPIDGVTDGEDRLVEMIDDSTFSIQVDDCQYNFTAENDAGTNDQMKANVTTKVANKLYDGSLALWAANDVAINISALTSGTTSGDIVLTETEATNQSANTITVASTYTSDDEYEVTTNANAAWVQGGEDEEGDYGYYLTEFGSYIETEADDNSWVKVHTPEEEVTYNVYVTSEVSSTQPGEANTLRVTDTEAASITDKNMIVVGGSCINSMAASLLGTSTATCGEAFTALTNVGAGQYLIQSFENGDNIAVLVAGYNQEDTVKGATYLVNQEPDVAEGQKWIGSTATEATSTVVAA